VLIGTLGPYPVKAADNPEGIDASVFSGIKAGLRADRPAALMEFLKNFYSVGGADGKLVSERVIQANWTVAIGALQTKISKNVKYVEIKEGSHGLTWKHAEEINNELVKLLS
jgi:non-heme chloroperoxidase